jgi:hypothetical protein
MTDDKLSGMQDKLLYCNFCGKSMNEVKLIAGPTVHICYECVDLCYDIRREAGQPKPVGEEKEKYRVTYPVLISRTNYMDFDTMEEAMAFDSKWRIKEDDMIHRHKNHFVRPTISKILERKL